MIEKKVKELLNRLKEVEEKLGSPEAFSDQKAYRALTQEHSYLTEINELWRDLTRFRAELENNEQMLKNEADEEFAQVLRQDIADLKPKVEKLQAKLENILIPPDPNDHKNTILELRAGTGGDEAALFVGDCVRMYKMFADQIGWKYEELSSSPSDIGGYKEYIMVLSGSNVHRLLQYEGGAHRVQRVPETEAQGRVHTSTITIAVLQEPDEESEVEIDEKDLRVDTYRSSGAGGQHVNTTDSAVRLTHIPTGIVAYCQEERSQHKNKEKAMRVLKAKIAAIEEEKRQKELASSRSTQIGTGERSERIRTYNFPQNRLTDHRINLTRYDLDFVMEGRLEEILTALVSFFYQQKLE